MLEGYLVLGSTEGLSSDVTAAFSAAVDAATSACVSEVVSSLPDVDASAAKCTNFLESAKVVPPECFCALLQEVRFWSAQCSLSLHSLLCAWT